MIFFSQHIKSPAGRQPACLQGPFACIVAFRILDLGPPSPTGSTAPATVRVPGLATWSHLTRPCSCKQCRSTDRGGEAHVHHVQGTDMYSDQALHIIMYSTYSGTCSISGVHDRPNELSCPPASIHDPEGKQQQAHRLISAGRSDRRVR